jgi:hypothetical protein
LGSFAILLAAAASLVYEGKPLTVTPSCRAEDLASIGLACSADEPCAMLLELSAAEVVGSRLLLAGNLHTTSVTVESLLFASEDGGRTWTEGYERIPSATLDHFQFIDFENGWISGQVMTSLPRDPFFLASRNGGKTWHRRPVYAEPKIGLIEGFRFTSRSQGALTIDRLQPDENGIRYELHRTNTGGDSWSLERLSDKPIPAQAAATSGQLRLRADAATGAYHVEQQAAGKWQTVAEFAIAAGDCRGSEAKTPEAAPEPPPEEIGKPKRL